MQQERDTTLDSVRIDQGLAEDLGPGDITTRATLGADRAVQASWIAKADGIVAVSGGVADDLAATLGLPRETIEVIYNPVVILSCRVR